MFWKRKSGSAQTAMDLLDAMECDALVARRGKPDRLLAMNEAARSRLALEGVMEESLEEYAKLFPELWQGCLAREGDATPFEVSDGEGRVFSVSCVGVEWVDGTEAILVVTRDVGEERATRERLYHLAYTDQLTGAPNRQRFREDFDAVAEQIENEALCGMVAIFDMDNFKSVNDTYGHNTGDIMLRRLIEHLDGDPAFQGHVYRLGGDEFVLFYAEPGVKSEQELRERYGDIVQGAFRTYGLPNIELTCTISMGISFFPRHGTTVSELLRKADIALYKAKEGGRDNFVFFEDRYDTAKKFRDLYIHIQPILTGGQKTYGYELIDRGNDEDEPDGEIMLTDANRTLDALGLEDIENDARYFIAYTRQLLSAVARRNLPRQKFIVQVRLAPAMNFEDLLLLRQLRDIGYTLAVTGLRAENAAPEIFGFADFFTFDAGSRNLAAENKIIRGNATKTFIAQDVNTLQDFDIAKRRGFKLYQGYFFEAPVKRQKTKELDPMRVNYLRLLELTSTDDYIDFHEIASIIASDVVLSYKLLKLLNSAAIGLRYRMRSIDMAVAYLGEDNLKRWIALLAVRGVVDDKPLELMRISLIRARFGELLAPHCRPRRDGAGVFMTGMFSLLHIALEKTQEQLFEDIPMTDDIRESLTTRHGIYSDLISFFGHYEYANWDEITRFAEANRLDPQFVNDCYIAAVKWYNELVRSV